MLVLNLRNDPVCLTFPSLSVALVLFCELYVDLKFQLVPIEDDGSRICGAAVPHGTKSSKSYDQTRLG